MYDYLKVDAPITSMLDPCLACNELPVLSDVAHDCARKADLIFQCDTDNCPLYGWPYTAYGYSVTEKEDAAKNWNNSLVELKETIFTRIKEGKLCPI